MVQVRKGPHVDAAIGAEPMRDREARHVASRIELQKAETRQVAAVLVVGRSLVADGARFEQRRRELRPRGDELEVVDQTQHLERPRRMAFGAREVAGQPIAELPRAADVEEPTVLAEEPIDAGCRRHVVQPIERDVHFPREAVGRLSLEGEQIAQTRHAAFDEPLDEDAQDLGRDARVAEATMSIEDGDAERARDAVEPLAIELGHEPACETEGAHRRRIDRPSLAHASRDVQVSHVERRVVRDQHRVAGELEEAW